MSAQLKTSGIVVALVLLAAAPAQALPPETTPAAPAAAETPVRCASAAGKEPRTPSELKAIRDCFEAQKFELEVANLKDKAAKALSQNFFNVLVALLGLAGTLAGARLNAHASFTELYDKRASDRQQHNAKLVETLHQENAPLRLTSAATMIARLATLRTSRGRSAAGKVAAEEFSYLSTIAFAALRDEKLPQPIAKYLADNLVGALRLKRRSLFAPARSRMSAYDVQHAHIHDAYWSDLDARGVDFFGAKLHKTSFRGADLRKAVFYDADLTKAVLIDADLRGANFQNTILHGANLSGANLTGALHLATAKFDAATKWDARTRWPKDFTPPARA